MLILLNSYTFPDGLGGSLPNRELPTLYVHFSRRNSAEAAGRLPPRPKEGPVACVKVQYTQLGYGEAFDAPDPRAVHSNSTTRAPYATGLVGTYYCHIFVDVRVREIILRMRDGYW